MRKDQYGGATNEEEEKLLAVKEYLRCELRLNHDDIDNMEIENIFNADIFKERISECGLEEIFLCSGVDMPTEILTSKLTGVLDEMAPVKKIQTRNNYAPWLGKETKLLKDKREAAETDRQEDWRLFRGLRNQVTAEGLG